MEKLRELEAKVIEWANDRNFFGEGGATLFGQYLKLREEFGELSGNFAKGRCMKDDIGDVAVVAIIMNKISGNESLFSYAYEIALTSHRNRYSTKEIYLSIDAAMSAFIDDNTERVTFILISSLVGFLTLFAESNNYNFTECLEYAYNEIKDRKGEWRNNTFVKTSDL